MSLNPRIVLSLLTCSAFAIPALGQEKPDNGKAKVALYWVEGKQIEGVTEKEGFQCSCDPKSIVYRHKKPALVLTAAEVESTRLTNHDFSANGLSKENYMVRINLTKQSRERLAATCTGKGSRMLTVVVDGRTWGVHRYEIDKEAKFVPEDARAETFTPEVGFMTSKAEAERIVNALK